jgi:hypothetical protein
MISKKATDKGMTSKQIKDAENRENVRYDNYSISDRFRTNNLTSADPYRGEY